MLSLYLRMSERSTAKNYSPVSLQSVVMCLKLFEKLKNNILYDHLKKFCIFFISSMVSGLFVQLNTYWQLDLIELLVAVIGLGILQLWHLIYPRLSTKCSMLVFFTNSIFMEFFVRCLSLFCLFLVIDGSRWANEWFCSWRKMIF